MIESLEKNIQESQKEIRRGKILLEILCYGNHYVVATTRWNGTHSLLTSAKLSVGYLVVGITRELDKKPSLHCSSIYINYIWSMLQQY